MKCASSREEGFHEFPRSYNGCVNTAEFWKVSSWAAGQTSQLVMQIHVTTGFAALRHSEYMIDGLQVGVRWFTPFPQLAIGKFA